MRSETPAGPVHLIRAEITPALEPKLAAVRRVHTDFVVSDASGSTGMRIPASAPGAGLTTRAAFNKLEEHRLLTRIRALPALLQAEVLRADDEYRIIFLVFDHSIKNRWTLAVRVGDVPDAATAEAIVAAAQAQPSTLHRQRASPLCRVWPNCSKLLCKRPQACLLTHRFAPHTRQRKRRKRS